MAFIDFHAIQTVPPANMNRDEDGSPKTAVYGGTRRARVSSQAWKRAIRRDFDGFLDQSELGVRSLRLVDDIAERIVAADPETSQDDAVKLATAALNAAGVKTKETKPRRGVDAPSFHQTGALLFLSNPQIEALARLAVTSDGKPTAKDAKAILSNGNSIDLALFGRMVADSPDLNVDAAAQVAHALGVHSVVPEFDYFTAVDDRAPEDNAGAGMIGTVEFNASTLYRYATVNLTELVRTLGSVEAVARAVAAFTKSFISAMPTGKQNTFANRTLPQFVLVTVRDDQPISLAGAFEEALDGAGNRARTAASRLAEEADTVHRVFDAAPLASYVLSTVDVTMPGAAPVTLSELVAKLSDEARERIETPA